MPTPRQLQFDAWSPSRLVEWEKCPFKAKCKHLLKMAEPSSPPMERGAAIHKEAEDYVLGKLKSLPTSLSRFGEEFQGLRARRKSVQTELQFALDRDWRPTSWFREAGRPNPWLRLVFDVVFDNLVKVAAKAKKAATAIERRIVDHKTGKVRAEQAEVMELYAIGGYAMEPTPAIVLPSLWYLDEGVAKDLTVLPKEVEGLKKRWGNRAAAMLADTAFVPTPGNHCRWCHLAKTKGGPCPY